MSEISQVKRATREDLQVIHDQLVAIFQMWMNDPVGHKVKPYHLEVVRKFLADNGVRKNLSKTQDINESLGELAGFDIPFSPNYLD